MFFSIFKKKDKSELNYCGLNLRLFTTMFDLLIMAICISPLVMLSKYLIYYGVGSPSELINNDSSNAYSNIINHAGFFRIALDIAMQLVFILIWIYGFWRFKQSTPAKMLFSIKIIDEKTKGIPTNKQFLLRLLGYLIAVIPAMLGIFWIAFDKKHQGWHDKMAGTIVVKE